MTPLLPINESILTGLDDSLIEKVDFGNVGVHQEVKPFLMEMRKAASNAGFDLTLASGFRSFESQLQIWNAKALGNRPVLDFKSQPIDIKRLSKKELVFSILRWSALPGMSRHHWGTDFDIFDKKTLPENYRLQLVSSEFEGSGFFAPLHDWLDTEMEKFGFFRPYATDFGGVSPERWHLSYAPLAQKYWSQLSLHQLHTTLHDAKLELKEEVLTHLPEIYDTYFKKIDLPFTTKSKINTP